MDTKEIIIEGHRYLGRFKIEESVNIISEEVTTEVGRHLSNRTYRNYGGEGIVTDRKTGLEQRFLVYPEGNDEKDLIILGKSVRDEVQDYKMVVDLSLQQMFEDAKNSEEIIPKVIPVCLDKTVLIEKV